MISSLLRAKFRLSRLRWPALFALLLGAAAVAVYQSPWLDTLRLVRAELPEVFTALGFFTDLTPQAFIAGYLFGFILPVFLSAFGVHSVSALVSAPLQDGRMALLLAAPYRRSAVLFTLGIAAILYGLLLCLAALAGQLLAALVLAPGADFPAIIRLNAGFMLVSAMCSALPLPIALLSGNEGRMRRRASLLMLLQLALLLASRLPGAVRMLRCLTFWSLFDSTALTLGSGGFRPAGLAFALALFLVFLSMLLFERREI